MACIKHCNLQLFQTIARTEPCNSQHLWTSRSIKHCNAQQLWCPRCTKCCNLQLKSLAIYLFGVMLYNLKHLIRLRRQCPSKMIWCWAVLGLAVPRRTETSVCLREPCFCLREPYAKIAIFFVGRVWGRWQGAVSLLVTSMHVLLAMHLHLAVHLHLALHMHLAMCFLLALHLHLQIQCKSIGNPWKLQYLQYRIKKMWTFESMHVDISLTPPTKI